MAEYKTDPGARRLSIHEHKTTLPVSMLPSAERAAASELASKICWAKVPPAPGAAAQVDLHSSLAGLGGR